MFNVLSLCSGIGGLDLAAKAHGGATVCYVEIDPFCQAVLGARMRDGWLDSAPIWPDLKTFSGMAWRGRVDCIVAGFPCQPHSTAGRRRGADDERDLWPEVRRVIGEVEPGVVFLENVAGLAYSSEGRAPYAALVVGELAEMGYDARWGIVGARDAGASHRRDRWFCLADASHPRFQTRGIDGMGTYDKPHRDSVQPEISSIGDVADAPGRGHAEQEREHDSVGRAKQPHAPERSMGDAEGIGRREGRAEPTGQQGRPDAALTDGSVGDATHDGRQRGWDAWGRRPGPSDAGTVGDPDDARLEGWCVTIGEGPNESPAWPPSPKSHERWGAILAERPDLAPAVEPALRGMADGPAGGLDRHRRRRLAALGNGVVPVQAALAWSLLESRLTHA